LLTPVRRALLSVSDKTGIVELARELKERGIELLSTGGTAKLLLDHGISVKEVAEHTGFPEIMGGRVKTLHPKIHGGLLGRRGTDEAVMDAHDIEPIDLLAVNLYLSPPRWRAPDCSYEEAVDNIDIGGPAMVRAAAKNHASVTVVVDPNDYRETARRIGREPRRDECAMRQKLAAKAFATRAVTTPWSRPTSPERSAAPLRPTDDLNLSFRKHLDLPLRRNRTAGGLLYRSARHRRLGDASQANPRQGTLVQQHRGQRYRARMRAAVRYPRLRHRQARQSLRRGAAGTLADAYARAYRTDPTSAYGGVIAFIANWTPPPPCHRRAAVRRGDHRARRFRIGEGAVDPQDSVRVLLVAI